MIPNFLAYNCLTEREKIIFEHENRGPVTRLAIIQESGIQLFGGRYERYIHSFVPFDDEEFGGEELTRLNKKTDLPYYLVKVEVKIIDRIK